MCERRRRRVDCAASWRAAAPPASPQKKQSPFNSTPALTVRQEVVHLSAAALVHVLSPQLVDQRPRRGVRRHHGQVGVRLHLPLWDVVVHVGDLQLQLVQVPVLTCRGRGEKLLVSQSDSCLVTFFTVGVKKDRRLGGQEKSEAGRRAGGRASGCDLKEGAGT